MGTHSWRARHARAVPALRFSRVRGEGEGPQGCRRHRTDRAAGPDRGRPRVLHERGERGRGGPRSPCAGSREQRRGRRVTGEDEEDRDLSVRTSQLVARGSGTGEEDLRAPRRALTGARIRCALVAVRLLQVVQGQREGPPSLRALSRDSCRNGRRGAGRGLQGGQGGTEARLGGVHPRAERRIPSASPRERQGRRRRRLAAPQTPKAGVWRSVGRWYYEPESNPGNRRFYARGGLIRALLEKLVPRRILESGAMEV